MKKTQILQISILVLIFLIGYFTFNYLNSDGAYQSSKIENEINEYKKDEEVELKNSNVIEKLSYKSLDESGNIYEISSAFGSIFEENENILLLKEVTAKISIAGDGIVYISSNEAKYDRINLNTHFFGDASLIYHDHNVTSNDIFLKYTEKEVEISSDVKYVFNNNNLAADVMSFDLINKVSKIYMTNKKDKVKVKIKN